MRLPHMKIRERIVIPIFSIILVTVTVATASVLLMTRQNFEREYFEHLKTTATLKATAFNTYLNQLESAVKIWSYGARVDLLEATLVTQKTAQEGYHSAALESGIELEIHNFFELYHMLNGVAFFDDTGKKIFSKRLTEIDDKAIDFNDFFHGKLNFSEVIKGPSFSDFIDFGEWVAADPTDYNVDKFTPFDGPQLSQEFFRSSTLDEKPENVYLFFFQPIYKHQELIGLIAFSIDPTFIDYLLEDTTGLGRSGQTYLVGRDFLMRSNSRFTRASTRLRQFVHTINTERCFKNNPIGVSDGSFFDYRGIPVIGNHVFLEELDWCLLSEIDHAESSKVSNYIFWVTLIGLLILLAGLYAGISLICQRITSPLKTLQKFSQQIEAGNLNDPAPILKDDSEIGDLANAFSLMMDHLRSSDSEVKQKVKAQTKEIRNQQKKLEAILKSIKDAILVVDHENKVYLCNEEACHLLGCKEGKILNSHYDEVLTLLRGKQKMPHPDLVTRAQKEKCLQESLGDTVLQSQDGRETPVQCTVKPIKISSQRYAGSIIMLRDTTKEREVDRMKTEFVSIASHQLRTPVTAIKWLVELLQEDNDYAHMTVTQKEYLSQISQSAKRMSTLVDDLLDVSRIETGRKFAVHKETADVRDCLHDAMMENQILAEQKGVEMVIISPFPQEIVLPIDQPKIVQVFHNFISNAIKYSPADSRVSIGCQEKSQEWVFSVADQGIGIPASEEKNIFTKFYRATNIRQTKSQGTGLGLYIARRIAEAHGGHAWFESKARKGTTFYFSLPKS